MLANSHAASGQEYLTADVRFHTSVLRASGNPMLGSLCTAVTAAPVGRTQYELMPSEASVEALSLHQTVAFCIGRGDGDGGATAMAGIVAEADAAVRRLAG